MRQAVEQTQPDEDRVVSVMDLTVVIPAHNSAAVIESTVRRIAEHLHGQAVEIIVVENGSTDATAERCRDLMRDWDAGAVPVRIMRSDKGLGNALRAGAIASDGARVLLTADDLPFGFDDLEGAAALGSELPPVLIGSKAHAESAVDRGRARGVLTGGFALLRRLILGIRTGDPQGTILVDGPLLRRLAPYLDEPGFLFTTELVYAAELAGIRPFEVPVRLSEEHSEHGTRVTASDVVSMATGLVRLRRRRRELAAAL